MPPVLVEISGSTAGLDAAVAKAKAALDSLKSSAGDVKLGVDLSTGSLARAALATNALTAATNRATIGGRRWTGWLATAHNILTVFGSNIVADTIGIVAFGVGAVAAFSPVVEAVGNLGATYGSLNPLQRVATVQITNFMDQFRNASQTGVFSVFTQLLNIAGSSIGKTGGITDQATHAFENFAAMLRQTFSSAPWQAMFSRSTGVIQKDLTALFGLINSLLNVIPALARDFNGLGLFAINGAAGILHLIAVIGNANPALARLAALSFLAYRALRAIGLFNAQSGLRGFISGMTTAGQSTSFLANTLKSVRTYGLGTTAFLLTGLTPAVLGAGAALIGAGVAAAALLVYYGNGTTKAQQFVASLAAQDHAVGNNIAGYERLSSQLGYYQNHLTQVTGKIYGTYGAINTVTNAQHTLTQAQQQAIQTANTLRANIGYLENTYHLTQGQAIELAQATGVNLAQAFNKGGGAAQQTRMKIAAYEQTIRAAQNPTSTLGYDLGLAANQALALTDRVTALTNAFNALLTPFANVIQDTANWKTGNLQLEQAVDKAKGKVDAMGSSTQRLAAVGLAQAINNTVPCSRRNPCPKQFSQCRTRSAFCKPWALRVPWSLRLSGFSSST